MCVLLYCIVYKCIVYMYYCIVLCIICICIYIILYVCLCMLQCGRTALPNTGVENYKSINQSINLSITKAASINLNRTEQARIARKRSSTEYSDNNSVPPVAAAGAACYYKCYANC